MPAGLVSFRKMLIGKGYLGYRGAVYDGFGFVSHFEEFGDRSGDIQDGGSVYAAAALVFLAGAAGAGGVAADFGGVGVSFRKILI